MTRILVVVLLSAAAVWGQSDADRMLEAAAAEIRAYNFIKAEFWLRELRAAYPEDLRWGPALIGVLQSRARIPEAWKLAEEIRPKHQDDPMYFYQIGRLLAETNQPQEAIASYRESIRMQPAPFFRGLAHISIGDIYWDLGEMDNAIASYRTGKELSGATLRRLPLALAAKGDQRSALVEYRAILSRAPNSAEAMNDVAYTLAELGESLDEATGFARRAAAISPGNSDITDTLGWVYFKKGMLIEAEEILLRSMGQDGGAKQVQRQHLRAVMDARGDWSEDRRELRKLLDMELRPNQLIRMKELLRKMEAQ